MRRALTMQRRLEALEELYRPGCSCVPAVILIEPVDWPLSAEEIALRTAAYPRCPQHGEPWRILIVVRRWSENERYYLMLGVKRDASAEEITRAYRQRAQMYHPDREAGVAERMVAINAAYETLSDPVRRQQYDAGIADLSPHSSGA